MTIRRPCLSPNNWITEYVIHPFPFYVNTDLHVTKLDVSQVWVTKTNPIIYPAVTDLLQEYNDEIPNLFWLPTISNYDVPAIITKLILQTSAMKECPNNQPDVSTDSQILPLGSDQVLFYVRAQEDTLYFKCQGQLIKKQLTTGLWHFQMLRTCRFQYPNTAKIVEIDVDTSMIKYKYVISPNETEHSTDKNKKLESFLDNPLFTYLLYSFCAILGLGTSLCIIWNMKAMRCIFRFCYQRCCTQREQPSPTVNYTAAPKPATNIAPIVTYAFQMM
jgi:hypothetical protein